MHTQEKRRGKDMAKDKGGRPTVMTGETLQKLEDAFLDGLSDRQACLVADISLQTLYNYGKENPEFLERKELLKENNKIRAKRVVSKELKNGNTGVALWYLERKEKEEFSTKQITELSGGAELSIDDKREQVVNHFKELKELKKRERGAETSN